MKKAILIITGCIGVGLGAVGAVLPLLPAFPFLLLAAVCFAKSSERLDRWFRGTKLYKNDLESFVNGQGMTKRTKIKVMITVTLLMAVGFAVMFAREVYIPCMILGGSLALPHNLLCVHGQDAQERGERRGVSA